MAVEFKEYRGKRKPINPQHKFPLLRLILLVVAVLAVYWSGLFLKIANALPLPGNSLEQADETWESRCTRGGGVPEADSDSLGSCTWVLHAGDSLVLPNPFLRYLSSLQKNPLAKIRWTATQKNFSNPIVVLFEDERQDFYLHMMKSDSSYVWIRRRGGCSAPNCVEEPAMDNGCRFPGVCPHMPLEWSALPITEGFDFEGQESLIAADVFRGLGEAPIHAVLPGRVVNLGKDSLGYFIEIDHGNNISSRTSGMGFLNEKFAVGDSVSMDFPIGKLTPLDSSMFYLSVRENGRFIRWKTFYEDAYPFTSENIDDFSRNIAEKKANRK